MKVYISAPISIPQVKLNEVWTKLFDNPYIGNTSYWNRTVVYDDKQLLQADAVVFILPSFKWKHSVSGMTRGSKSELEKALALNKPIYIAYYTQGIGINANPGLFIYNARVANGLIEGVAGTSNKIFENAREFNLNTIPSHIKQYPIAPVDTIVTIHDPTVKEVEEKFEQYVDNKINMMLLLTRK